MQGQPHICRKVFANKSIKDESMMLVEVRCKKLDCLWKVECYIGHVCQFFR